MRNGMEKIPFYKTDAMKLLCQSDEFRRLMANGRCPNPSAKQLLDTYLMPWEFVPDTAAEEASYVCCEVDIQSVNSNVTSTYLLQFYILVHRSLMRMPDGEPGSRADLLTIEINRIFNGNDSFGLGRAAVLPFTHYTVGGSFYGRYLAFAIDDLFRGGALMDALQLFRGRDYAVGEHIVVHHPSVGEICDYGEHAYYTMVMLLTATPSDLKVQLADMGVDYEAVDEFQLFAMLCKAFPRERTSILLGETDLSALEMGVHTETREFILVSPTGDVVFDRVLYELFVSALRQMHGLKKNTERAGNAITKQILIDEARRKMQRQGEPSSLLLPILSALTNSPEFGPDWRDVWDMPVYTIMDAVRRIQKIRNYHFIMSGVYGGNVDVKKVARRDLDWMGEL